MSTPSIGADVLLAFMKKRRVCRSFTDAPVDDELLWKIAQAGRWATSAGNRHLHKFVIVRDAARIKLIRAMSPGMLAEPPALLVIATDEARAVSERVQIDLDDSTWIDVGTAAMNMSLMANAIGLGSCPVTSFSQSGVAEVLSLPQTLKPEYILILGWPKPIERFTSGTAPKALTARDLTYWETVGNHER
jgi:nitroreductase